MLARAGIQSATELRRIGSVAAYVRVKRAGCNASLNLLWGLESALCGLPWQEVARVHRTSLCLRWKNTSDADDDIAVASVPQACRGRTLFCAFSASASAFAVVIGGTVGVGILRSPGAVAAQLGSGWLILLVWTLGGLYTLLAGQQHGELATMMPRAGGPTSTRDARTGTLAVSSWAGATGCSTRCRCRS
jgi:hypothetical protein